MVSLTCAFVCFCNFSCQHSAVLTLSKFNLKILTPAPFKDINIYKPYISYLVFSQNVQVSVQVHVKISGCLRTTQR